MIDSSQDKHLSPRSKKIISIISLLVMIAFFAAIAWFVGRPMIQFVREPEHFRAWVDDRGFLGRLAFIGMQVLQVIVAVIPGEPLEMGAGYAFGAFEGTLLCLVGILIGSAAVFVFTRFLGSRAVEAFFSREKIASLKFLQNEKRLSFIVFILFFIPGTPKDLLSYFGGLTPMKLHKWLILTTLARIPSVLTSTVAGNAFGEKRYIFAVITLCVTLLISGAGILVYSLITKKHGGKASDEPAKAEDDDTKTDTP